MSEIDDLLKDLEGHPAWPRVARLLSEMRQLQHDLKIRTGERDTAWKRLEKIRSFMSAAERRKNEADRALKGTQTMLGDLHRDRQRLRRSRRRWRRRALALGWKKPEEPIVVEAGKPKVA